MFASKVIKRIFLIPSAVVVAKAQLTSNENESDVCRPSELPIYTPESHLQITNECTEDNNQTPPGFIENSVRTVRQTLTKYSEEFKAYERVAGEQIDKSIENVDWLVTYLRQEDNTMPKAGAIGIGALTGLIFGLRGGLFKRTVYATTGALGMAAVCYPKEAAEFTQVGLTEGKKYFTVAYNFVYGVKKGDPPLELPTLPKLPSSVAEAWDTVKNTATSLVSDQPQEGCLTKVSGDAGPPK